MANKKISELQTRTPSLTDLILVGDPSNGFSYKCTVSALATIIETDIADGYVTLGTTQTISGAKTFSNNLTLTSVANASTDPDKFLVLNGSNVVNYRTGSEVLSDIGGQGTITLTTTGTSGAATFAANTLNIPQYQGVITLTTTGTSGAATLVGNTLNIPNYAPDLSGYVPTSRTITINGTTQDLTANRTYNVGTVTSVAASGGTGISISGSPITSSGTITITNTAPDQVVALTAGTGISISGTYPNFTITNSSPSLGGTVTSVALSAPTGFAVTGSPITSSGTLALAFASGYSLPTTASQTNWDSAYNNMIVSAAVTGTTTKTLTLTQQDAGTITASWTDDNTDAVTSVFGRTGAVVATEGDYSLTQLSDVTITSPTTGQVLKYNGTIWVNDTDANTGTVTSVALSAPTGFSVSGSPITSSGTLALSFASGYSLPTTASQTNWDTAYTNRITSLTTTGSSGAATLISNTLNIPNYTLAGLGGISLTSLSASAPLSYNNTTGAFSISQSNTTTDGYLSSTDWNTFNGKIGGSGTSNYVPKFTATSTLGNSQIFDNGTNVGINTATPSEKLEVSGILRVSRTTSASVYLNITAESGNIIFDARGSSDQIFHTQTLERLRIGLGGDITISTINNATIDTDKFLVSDSGVIKYRTGSEILSDIGGQGALTLTTTGTSGAATLVGNTLNIPQYSGGGGSVSGTTNYIAKFTSSTAVGDSRFFDNGTVTFLGNGDVNATPSTGIFSGTGGTGTNIAGAELRLRGGASTGNAAGGIISFYTSAAGSSGTGVNAATEVMRIIGGNTPVIITANGATLYSGMNITNSSSTANLFIGVGGNTVQNLGLRNVAYVLTNNASSLVFATNDAVRMTINSTGSIGIGTTTIGSALQVNGNAAIGYSASTAAPTNGLQVAGNSILVGTVFAGNAETSATPATGIISGTGGTGTNIAGAEFRIRGGASTGSGAGGPITFYTSAAGSAGTGVNAATEIARFDTRGNLGLGVVPAAWGSLTNAIQLKSGIGIFSNTSGLGGLTNNVYAVPGTNDFYITSNFATRYYQYQGEHVWQTAASGTANNAITFTTGMYLNSSSNLGIGTTTIGSRLQVNGNAAIGYSASTAAPTNGLAVAGNTGIGTTSPSEPLHIYKNSDDAALQIQNNTYSSFLRSTSSGTQVGTNSNTLPIYFYVGAGEKMRITSGGNVGIGTTTIGSRLQVNGNAAIGYSASTAAPTNGLSISGNTTIGTTTAAGKFTIDPDDNQVGLAITGTSLTGSNAQSLIDLAQTWNTTGNPTAIKLNITNTASGATANLMDLQVGGTSEFKVTKAGYVGINQGTPTSMLHTQGSVATAYSSKTATYTLDSTDYTVVFNVSSAVTANLPDATTCTGRIYVIKINNTTNTDAVTIDPNGAQTIDGNATYTIHCQYGIMIQSDGANWRIIADFGAGLNCL